jgi:glycosyltransferase involved in cell wall biosynthesis
MKIAIILNESYPHGMACSKRIHLYAKGLIELGNMVKIFIPKPTENYKNVKNNQTSGVFDDVSFQYASKYTIRNKHFFFRRLQEFVSYFALLKLVLKFDPDIIIIAGNHFSYILLGKVCAIIKNSKLVREKSEVPFYNREKISCIHKFRIKVEFMFFDALIAISSPLKNFFEKEILIKIPIIEIPILVNLDEIRQKKTAHPKKPILVYSGSLVNKKDGILIIISAFKTINKYYPDAKLILTGDINNSPDKQAIIDMIQRFGLKNNVELTGYISHSNLYDILSSATALLLAKPENRQNRYNMATKIGEYLLTGQPVILSSIDPACKFLKYRYSAFIIKPLEDEIVNAVQFIIENPEDASKIGLNGMKAAIQNFNYKSHTLRMQNFFNTL